MWEKVLIADDNIDIRDKFYQILSSLCYKVTCVPTGKEALLRLTEERFDLILLDQQMPQLNGLDTAKDIRKFDKEARIILLLDNGESQNFKVDEQYGFLAVIKKDFSTHFMMKKILEVLKEPQVVKNDSVVMDSLKQKKILLIDDNPQVREVLKSFLEKKGYKILDASSGEEGLMKAKTERCDLVLCDIRMPGMDGIMTLRQLKQLDESLKVVILTSAQEEYIVEEAKKEGASDYIVKPCDFQKLDALITALML